jgi:RNA polymerase sigma factor (sigma-70 family)
MPSENEPLPELCRQISERLLEKRGWQLVEAKDAFIAEVLQKAQAWRISSRLPLDQVVERAAINSYCEVWYEACKPTDADRQRRALIELHDYIYKIALHLTEGDKFRAEEITQDALLAVYESLAEVRNPGSFMGYVRQVTRHRMLQLKRQEAKQMTDDFEDEEIKETASLTSEAQAPSPDDQPQSEQRQKLEALITHCLRSVLQQQVIMGVFLDNLSMKDLADQLGKTLGHIRKLKHEALEKLKKCGELLEKLQKPRADDKGPDTDDLSGAAPHLAQAIAGVPDSQLSCAECQAQLPGYIEAEINGFNVVTRYPAVKHHLDLCLECEAEYIELLDLALAEDSVFESAIQPPEPDLWFLPAPSLGAYVRRLTGRLVQALHPDLLEEMQSFMEPFLERAQALGKGPLPVLAPVLGEGPEALRLLAATYATTHTIVTTFSPEEIKAQAEQNTLGQMLRQQAEHEAQRQGLEPPEARAFAEQYAALASRDAAVFQTLVIE